MSRHLVRTNGGRMIHKSACHMAQRGGAVPWEWADTVAATQVNFVIWQNFYRCCKRCIPQGGVNA